MASQILFQQFEIVELAPGQTITIEHDLHINSVKVKPDIILPNNDTPIGTVAADVTDEHVIFTNNGTITDTVTFLLWNIHTIIGQEFVQFYWKGGNDNSVLNKDLIIYVSPSGNNHNSGTMNKPVKTITEALKRQVCCWGLKNRIRLLGEASLFDESASPLVISIGNPIGPDSEPLVIEGQMTKNLSTSAGWSAGYTAVAPEAILSTTLSAPVLAGATTVPVTAVLPPHTLGVTLFTQIQVGTEPAAYGTFDNDASTISFFNPLTAGYVAGTPVTVIFDPIMAVTVNVPAGVPSFSGVSSFYETGAAGRGLLTGGDLMGVYVTCPDLERQTVIAHGSHVQGVANQVTFVFADVMFGYLTGDTMLIEKPGSTIKVSNLQQWDGSVVYSALIVDNDFGQINIGGRNSQAEADFVSAWIKGDGVTNIYYSAFHTGGFISHDGHVRLPSDVIPAGAFISGISSSQNFAAQNMSEVVFDDVALNKSVVSFDGNSFGVCFSNGGKDSNIICSGDSVLNEVFTLMVGSQIVFGIVAFESGQGSIVSSTHSGGLSNGLNVKNSRPTLLGLTGVQNAGVGVEILNQGQCQATDDGVFFVNNYIDGVGGDVLIGADLKAWTALKGAEKGWTELVAQGGDNVSTGNIIRIGSSA